MMALFFAIRLTPMASVMVTAAGSPSGIAPTARATAAINISTAPSPRQIPTANVTAARTRMAIRRMVLKEAIFRVRGVDRSAAEEMSSEIRPVSVLSPVATTTARACP
ncbi:MAG: hypothetical protein BWX55_00218 [Deltaproteobacteria bacterium ADurb.Bin022]|nr:MAG: hypothetical protein BWX55_00218 [Deltaproteobacteria bacterium ADurb.Bin022]